MPLRLVRTQATISFGRLLEDDVSIGAAKSKRVDASAGRPHILGPGCQSRRHLQTQRVKRDLWVRGFEMQVAGDFAMLEAKYRLDQSRHSRCRFQMSNICLYRTDEAWGVCR